METDHIEKRNAVMKTLLLVISCTLLSIGTCGGPLVMRLYFIHGGKRVWLSSWLQTGGWPIIFIPIAIGYYHRRKTEGPSTKLFFMKLPLFMASAVIGVLTGLDRLPLRLRRGPTSCLHQKFTSFSINAVVLLTMGAAVLGLNTSSDRPEGETNKEYIAGFFMTVAAAALYGFVLPLIKLTYKKAKQTITYALVLEIQSVMCLFATLFCTVGMLINNDFKLIPREARKFDLGETRYYMVLVLSAIVWQAFFLGAIGIIFCAPSLLSGIVIAVLLPITEILAVIFYHEKFQPEKGVSLALSVWGFVSYFYGEIKQNKQKEKEKEKETEMETEIAEKKKDTPETSQVPLLEL
ncbi:hypothetical protein ACFX15_019160 [Malus domestica]